MSSSSEYSVFSGSRMAKSSAEKFTFSHTCSLLSQYIKENGTLRYLTLGMTQTAETNDSPETSCHSATTMELFPTIIKQRNPTTVDFLSPQSAYPHHSEVPTMIKSSAFKSMEKEPKAAQLTIFYAGQVVVFDDFPAEKLEEIMSLAGKGISQSQNTSACAHTHNQQGINPSFEANVSPQAPSRPIVCELPIARKASLHRFLSKRKDRIASKAPYQINNPNSASNKPAESMTWLGLGAQSTQVHLQF